MEIPNNPQAWHQLVAPWLTVLTPITIVGIAWKLRGWIDGFENKIDNLVNNHLAHAKLDIIDAVNEGVKVESAQHQGIIDAVREANADTAVAVRQSGDRIVDTLIALNK
jgi:hypothetical protein